MLFTLWRWAVANPRAMRDPMRVYMRSLSFLFKRKSCKNKQNTFSSDLLDLGLYPKNDTSLSYDYYAFIRPVEIVGEDIARACLGEREIKVLRRKIR